MGAAIIIVDSVRHVVVDDVTGLFDREKLFVILLEALLLLVVDVASHNEAIVFTGGIDGYNFFAFVDFIDAFFERGHASLEIVAFRFEESLLNLIQIDFAGCYLNLRLAGDIVLGSRAGRATCYRQTDGKNAEGAKNAQATFHLDTPKLIQLHYNNAPGRK